MNATCTTSSASDAISTGEIDASCRVPLFTLLVSAAVWLVVASVFGLIASLKFHSPNFLSECACLTYGRVHPVATNALLYGFAMQAGLGVALWIIARTSQARVAQPWLIAVGSKLWNFGLTIGVIGILIGDSTGYENLEMPRGAVIFLFLGYLLMAFFSLVTLHNRRERALGPSQWFLLAALFWFPWIYFTANYLLLSHTPVRGVTQAIVAWWYSGNLNLVWFGLVGLAVVFHLIQQLMDRPLFSRYLALLTFWTIILFASWSGIPSSAPVPAWIPAMSTVATVLTLVTALSVMVNIRQTCGRGCAQTENPAPGKFIAFGTMAFVVAWLMNALGAIPEVSAVTNFTWYTVAQSQLNVFGFFAMTMFGAIYYIVPRVTGMEWPCAKSPRRHYWLAAIGIILIVLPLAIGGVVEGFNWHNLKMTNVDVAKNALNFLRVSTLGEVLILLGNLMLLGNLIALSVRYYKIHFVPVYRDATATLKPAEAKP
ncbi:MAG TPA: cbb3-type cytochrome c oxidase subunit I [Verrucomicrobiae bacterium]